MSGPLSRAKWTIQLGLLVIVSAWVSACNVENASNATSEPGAPTPALATSTTATRAPVATDRPTLPPIETPLGGFHPSAVCGPHWLPPDGDTFHQHFLHWTRDGWQLIFDVAEAVWTVDSVGGQVRQIVDPDPERGFPGTVESNYGFYADVSPDSSRIVYSTCEFPTDPPPMPGYQDDNPRQKLGYEIAVVNIDGTSKERITRNAYFEHYPVWSPDSSKIAYLASPSSSSGLYTYRDALLQIRSLEDPGDASIARSVDPLSAGPHAFPPSWSPDGQLLAFLAVEIAEDYLSSALYAHTVKIDGTELSKLGESTALPTWSPDGSKLAFAGPAPNRETSAIYVIKPNGSDKRVIWSDESHRASRGIYQVSWSPDGSELLFISNGVYVVSSEGEDLRRISRVVPGRFSRFSGATLAAWSPDGSNIAVYHPDRELVTMDRNGKDQRILVKISNDGTVSTP